MRDADRSAVYAAEDLLTALLDRGGTVDFHGSLLEVPRQRHFAALSDVGDYLTAIRSQPWGCGHTPAPRLRVRRGTTRAHWSAPVEIALPDTDWAMSEMVVLHEYAHHVTWHDTGRADHAGGFRDTMSALVGAALSPAAALVLTAAYHGAGATQESAPHADARSAAGCEGGGNHDQ